MGMQFALVGIAVFGVLVADMKGEV